jgi:hypothetical protein
MKHPRQRNKCLKPLVEKTTKDITCTYWEDNIKTYLRDMGGGVEWINLAQNMQQWLFLLNTAINGQVS